MPEAWIAQLLGPLGLVVGCVYALYQFSTEGWVSGKTMSRQRDQNADLLQQNKDLIRQNEALQRRLDRLAAVSGRLVEHAEKVEPK